MSLTTEIQRLRTNINNVRQDTSDILEAIANKGVTVPAGSNLDDCAGLIADIPTGGGDFPSDLITLDYFSLCIGEHRTSGSISSLDGPVESPFTNTSELWTLSNNRVGTDLTYLENRANTAIQSGTFSIEYFGKVTALGSSPNTSALAGLVNVNNYWASVIAPHTNAETTLAVWHNDTQYNFLSQSDTRAWHHYEISVDNGSAYYFYDGNLLANYDSLDTSNTFFTVYGKMSSRATMQIAQLAIWNTCKHTSNFSVNHKLIV